MGRTTLVRLGRGRVCGLENVDEKSLRNEEGEFTGDELWRRVALI